MRICFDKNYNQSLHVLFVGTNSLHFEYSSDTGILTVKTDTTIDSAMASSYTLTLMASTGGTSADGTATLTVNVQSTCDDEPESTTVAGGVKSTTVAGGVESTTVASGVEATLGDGSGAIQFTVEIGLFFLGLMSSIFI